MKQLFTITLLVLSLISTAQNTASPTNIGGKDIYVLLVNISEYDVVDNVKLTKEQIATTSNFEESIHFLINKVKIAEYDAISTRDGESAQVLKYKNKTGAEKANVPNLFGKEMYFLSNPTKKYKVVATKEITETDLKKSFYNVSSIYSKNENVVFDAVIISGNIAQYIQYKK